MLMYQVLLTRIFSVTRYYHFAFAAVTEAMFGLALGARVAYQFRDKISAHNAHGWIAWSCLAFGWLSLIALLYHMTTPVIPISTATGIFSIVSTVVLLAGAFTAGGFVVCLALTMWPQLTARLYAIDLVGAALGALTALWVLPHTNGPAIVLVILVLSGLSALSFQGMKIKSRCSYCALLTTGVALLLFVVDSRRGIEQSFFRLTLSGDEQHAPPLYERWNLFSRVTVSEMPSTPFGWGLSSRYSREATVEQKYLVIDSGASTPITRFDGSFAQLGHLKADVVNLVHHIRPTGEVFVIGVGGGRDILAALAFGHQSVKGAEINPHIIEAVGSTFGEFSGGILQHSGVSVVLDEARSFISREDTRYDVIQASLVDTFAATSSGAFALSENSLYTVEAWERFMRRLKPSGVLSISRWWQASYPVESYRTVTLASASLRATGISDPQRHLIGVVNKRPLYRSNNPDLGVFTILASPTPFSQDDISSISALCQDLDFELVLSPNLDKNDLMAQLVNDSPGSLADRLHMQLTPPTDQSPFFFHLARFKDIILGAPCDEASKQVTLGVLCLIIVLLPLSYMTLIAPVLRSEKTDGHRTYLPAVVYFAAIGFGYMLLEVAQMQWFSAYLGHPTYGITVVLCALLLSTGIGSYCTSFITENYELKAVAVLILIGAIVGAMGPVLSGATRDSELLIRLWVAVGVLVPLGIVLGFGFPLGMRVITRRNPECAQLLWGVNGAASVCAGAVALLIALTVSITATFWTGLVCYVVAWIAMRNMVIK